LKAQEVAHNKAAAAEAAQRKERRKTAQEKKKVQKAQKAELQAKVHFLTAEGSFREWGEEGGRHVEHLILDCNACRGEESPPLPMLVMTKVECGRHI